MFYLKELKEFQHLQIPLKDIKSATNNFGETNHIGRGGFGMVYRGELVISEKLTMVAMKRLNTALGQGAREFWREIMLLSQYKHENLVSLLGFCAEEGENILVYEFLPNKSLDLYLSSPDLSWNQRLRICIDAAQGLEYLHEPAQGSQQRVLHRDIKSANILLDHKWNAKIADFGLSRFGPANQQFTYQITAAVGTPGYCDPLYVETYFLTKESDVYSFGAVLFEVLCGRPCVEMIYKDERRLLTRLAQKCYDEKRLDTIISTHRTAINGQKEEISDECLERFSKIAYQCLKRERTERPSMAKIVKELEIALEYQEEYELTRKTKLQRGGPLEYDSDEYWGEKLPTNLDAIIKMFKIPHAIYSIKKELFSFLHKGCLFDSDKQFFWINDDGKKCVLMSPANFLLADPMKDEKLLWMTYRDSRYSNMEIVDYRNFQIVKCHIKTSMLSLGTMYTASMVFRLHAETTKDMKMTKIKWKTEELSVCSTHNAIRTHDSWYTIKMWQFVNDRPDADFDIVLEQLLNVEERLPGYGLIIRGFEFVPVEMHEDIESIDEVDMDNGDEEYWEKMLPHDYRSFIQKSDKPLDYTTKKELYLYLCEGFLGHLGESRLWFFLCKSTRQICSMLPATDIIKWDDRFIESDIDNITLSESRLPMVIKTNCTDYFKFECRLKSPMFSPHHIYACYLVFKFQDNQTQADDAVLFEVRCSLDGTTQGTISVHMNLYPFNIPTIKPTNDYGSHESSSIPTIERHDQMHKHHIPPGCSKVEERMDGWMEVMLCKPLRHLQDHKSLEVNFPDNMDGLYIGMIIEGIEFRPFIL